MPKNKQGKKVYIRGSKKRAKAQAKLNAERDAKLQEAASRRRYKDRPELHWTQKLEWGDPVIHPINCNCNYCFHVRNCQRGVHGPDSEPCYISDLGMRIDFGPETVKSRKMPVKFFILYKEKGTKDWRVRECYDQAEADKLGDTFRIDDDVKEYIVVKGMIPVQERIGA